MEAISFDPDTRVVRWNLQVPADPPTMPFELLVSGYCAAYGLNVDQLTALGDIWETHIEPPIRRIRQRAAPRKTPRPGLIGTIRSPSFGEIGGALLDFSQGGLRMMGPATPGIREGELVELSLSVPDSPSLPFPARLRQVAPHPDGHATYRLSIADTGKPQWRKFLRTLYSWCAPGAQLSSPQPEGLMRLFVDSGYLNLSGKEPADFTALQEAFALNCQRLAAAPEIGYYATWPNPEAPDATIALLKVYESAWLGLHMAKRPGKRINGVSGRDILRDIHLAAYEAALIDPQLRWFIGYVQQSTRFTRLIHWDLPNRFVSSGHACIQPFQAFKVTTESAMPSATLPQVRTARTDELPSILEAIAHVRPRSYMEALDLTPERFLLPVIRKQWENAGFERERTLLVATKGERHLAVAVLERASPGLHLYGLLDLARLYVLTPDGLSAYPALLEGARTWYRQHGRRDFAYFCEHTNTTHAMKPGFTDLGKADMTLLSVICLPELLDHMVEMAAVVSAVINANTT
jgi:hypothetical protein